MRTIKEPEVRKNEILDIAERLFYAKGYARCTVSEILEEAGIAKGTFYYYFASKEEVLDGVIRRYTDEVHSNLEKMRRMTDLPYPVKLMGMFEAMQVEDQIKRVNLDDLHNVENTLLHQKILSRTIAVMTPVLVETILEGEKTGAWRCAHPVEYMQIFLASALTLTDEGIFEDNEISQPELMQALIALLEKMLEAEEGEFLNLYMNRNNNDEGDFNELAYH